MAVREIKTTIALDGEQQFKRAIAAVSKELRVSESELKAVASAYDLNGDKMKMLTDKQRILGEQVAQQENIASALRRALKEMQDAYDEAGRSVEKYRQTLKEAEASGDQSEIDKATKDLRKAEAAFDSATRKVQDYQIQVNNAEDKLNRYRKTQQATDRELEELGRDSIKAGRQIEEGIGESAEAAEKDVKSLVNTIQDDLSAIRANTTFTAIGGLWDMATDAYSSVSGFVEGTQEYRRQLSFLEQSAEEGGFGFDVIKDKLIETQALTADASSAMEGLSNLVQIEGLNEDQLTRAIQGLLGASILFQNTFEFASLAEGLQETLATGEAAGAYADLLKRLEVNLEEFNAALNDGELREEDVEQALAYLEANELKEAYEEYRKNNEDLIKEMETIARLEYQTARLGEKLSKYLITPIQSKFADLLGWMADEIEAFEGDPAGYMANIPERIVNKTTNIIEKAYDAAEAKLGIDDNSTIVEKMEEHRNEVINPDVVVANEVMKFVAKMFGMGDEEITPITYDEPIGPPTAEQQWRQQARAWLESTFAARENLIPTDQWGTAIFDRYTAAQTAAMDALESFREKWVSPEEAEAAGKEAGTAFMDGLGATVVWNEEDLKEAEGFGGLKKQAGVDNWEEVLKEIQEMESDYEDAGEESGAAMVKGFGRKIADAEKDFLLAGQKAAMNFGKGLASKVSYVSAQAGALAAAATARLNASAGRGSSTVILNLDGREVARGLAPYSGEEMAVQVGWS